MGDRIDVEVLGLDELVSGSRKLFRQIGKSADRRFGDVAERRARIARGIVPRLSGTLAASVAHEGAEVQMGEGVPYAGWVEWGGTRGRPYFPEGRYFWPVAYEQVESELQREGTAVAQHETRGFQWPSPT